MQHAPLSATLARRFGPVKEKAANTTVLDFEKPLVELDNRIKEVRGLSWMAARSTCRGAAVHAQRRRSVGPSSFILACFLGWF
jgi:hypothetical protein